MMTSARRRAKTPAPRLTNVLSAERARELSWQHDWRGCWEIRKRAFAAIQEAAMKGRRRCESGELSGEEAEALRSCLGALGYETVLRQDGTMVVRW